MPLSCNHEYDTRSKDNINADPLDILLALSKVVLLSVRST